jgi:phycocyanobilin:ferredoxin oxidoreductase
MSVIWDKLIETQDRILDIFDEFAVEKQEETLNKFHQPENGWLNKVWANPHVRRAHIDVVDVRDSKGLWMMHVCCFPTLTNDAPIYGFDVIAGKNKMTGAFHDFSASSGGEEHPLVDWYQDAVADFIPSKKRELPEWARNIFSPRMIAAGNVSTEEEATAICDLAVANLRTWFESVPEYTGNATVELTAGAQNYYCHNQQQNPHTPRTMKSLGLPEADVDEFCADALFPKIV